MAAVYPNAMISHDDTLNSWSSGHLRSRSPTAANKAMFTASAMDVGCMSRSIICEHVVVDISDNRAGRSPYPGRLQGMATLDQTLDIFRALLDAEPTVPIGKAEEAIWAYLSSVQGLTAQADALEVLRAKTIALGSSSAFMPRLLDDLDRHQRRLNEWPI